MLSRGNVPQTGADVLALANYLSPILAQAFAGAGLGIMAVRFLYEVYENLYAVRFHSCNLNIF